MNLELQRNAFLALAAAALFGAGTPLAKLLLHDVSPLMLAGLLYLGSGAGLLIVRFVNGLLSAGTHRETGIQRRDYPWLAASVLLGGVCAPILLMWGLKGTTASGASLLLNLESVVTILVAAAIFREAVGARIWLAAIIMLAGALLLSYDPAMAMHLSPHSLAVAAACVMWAFDNNLTRRISSNDPMTIAIAKGMVAGVVNTALAWTVEPALPNAASIASAMLVGLFSYGISLVLFIHALRHLGSARASAHFSTAPFMGAAISVLLLDDALTGTFVLALLLMIVATWLVLSEHHQHQHAHAHMAHTHSHHHDEHHQHRHDGSEGAEPHSHAHTHPPLTHAHPHLPDIHHRHEH